MLESELIEGVEYSGDWGAPGRFVGSYYELAGFHQGRRLVELRRDDGRRAHVYLDTLVRISPIVEPAKVAEGDRLFAGEFNCALCGANEFQPGERFDNPDYRERGLLDRNFRSGRRACADCRDKFGGVSPHLDWCVVDREISRRQRLAANAQRLSGSPVPKAAAPISVEPCPDCKRNDGKHHLACERFWEWMNPNPSPPNAADAEAWRMHEEALAPVLAAEKRRAEQNAKSSAVYAQVQALEFDRAKRTAMINSNFFGVLAKHDARAKPKEDEGPAYRYPHWEEQFSSPGWED